MIRRPLRHPFLLALLISLLLSGTAVLAQDYKPVVGEPHPPVVFKTIEHDKVVSLSDYRGKKVVLVNFASW